MKKLCLILAWVFVLTLVYPSLVLAQRGMGGGWDKEGGFSRTYNLQTVETLAGEVTRVEQVSQGLGGRFLGVHMDLKTDQETVHVHLGPAWFINDQGFKIEVADQLKVKGSRVMVGDQPVIIAGEITKGDNVMVFRDEKGFPEWARWKR